MSSVNEDNFILLQFVCPSFVLLTLSHLLSFPPWGGTGVEGGALGLVPGLGKVPSFTKCDVTCRLCWCPYQAERAAFCGWFAEGFPVTRVFCEMLYLHQVACPGGSSVLFLGGLRSSSLDTEPALLFWIKSYLVMAFNSFYIISGFGLIISWGFCICICQGCWSIIVLFVVFGFGVRVMVVLWKRSLEVLTFVEVCLTVQAVICLGGRPCALERTCTLLLLSGDVVCSSVLS